MIVYSHKQTKVLYIGTLVIHTKPKKRYEYYSNKLFINWYHSYSLKQKFYKLVPWNTHKQSFNTPIQSLTRFSMSSELSKNL